MGVDGYADGGVVSMSETKKPAVGRAFGGGHRAVQLSFIRPQPKSPNHQPGNKAR